MRRLVATALVIGVAAGCGFERESPFAGVRLPDVGPWQDLGPLTVCHLGRRLAAPSLGDAGVCMRGPDTAGGFCATDGDCQSRERCICGWCSVTACDSADECGPAGGPLVCSFADRRCDHPCDQDGDCAAGERCLPGRHVCRGTCASSADCQHGETCQTSTGLCVTTVCAADADCGAGNKCWPQRAGALLAEPAPLVAGDAVELWLERTDGDGVARIWHGRGDGTQFTLDADPLFDGAAPSVARLPDGSYAMVFARGVSLFAARSPDAVAWSAATPALPNARQPSLVIQADGTPALYVIDPDGNLTRFSGTADLTFSTPRPVLTPALARTPLWPDVDALASPFADPYVDADGSTRLRLWFAAHGTETGPSMQSGTPTPTPPDWSIGLAVSLASDNRSIEVTLDASNPVFDRTTDFINHPSELDPAVVHLTDRWLLYYRRAKPDGTAAETLAVAVSPATPQR
jgi:hypothetical protein